MLEAGYQVRFVEGLPNPESPGFPVNSYMAIMAEAIASFQPHLLMSASKGAPYMMAAWEHGIWTGPSVMINRHPTLRSLPPNMRFVLSQGSRDETYPVRSRQDLEDLIRSGTPNHAMLFYTGDGGSCGGWGSKLARYGDSHNQASLQEYDCLPRLADAAMALHEAPDISFMRSWLALAFSAERLYAEASLGYTPEALMLHWTSDAQSRRLVEVAMGSAEHAAVLGLFWARPKVERDYDNPDPGVWESSRVLSIERVENPSQAASCKTHIKALSRSLSDQGVAFEPGLHTRWAFHGSGGIDTIVQDPLGFRVSPGGRSVWGIGTYFARDAEYCCDGGFCQPSPDGTRKLLVCLVSIGIPCAGDPTHCGVLPHRQGQHRFNSAVDSMSNPEVYITHSRGSAYPAYVITFV